MNKKGGFFTGFIVCLIFIVLFFLFFADFGLSTGKGQQAGIISEVERCGIIFKQPVVKLLNIQPNYSQADTSYNFGASEEIANQAEQYIQNNTKVVVYYETKYFVWAWDYSDRTIITKIEVIK